MKLSEFLHERDVYIVAQDLMICKSYLMNISTGNARPGLRLARAIEEYTNGKVSATDLRDLEGVNKRKCPHCGQYMRVKK